MTFNKKLIVLGLYNMIHNGLPDICNHCSLCCDGCRVVSETDDYSRLPPYFELEDCEKCLDEASSRMKCKYVKNDKEAVLIHTDEKPKCNQTELLKILLEKI